jgi:hypothetical protein
MHYMYWTHVTLKGIHVLTDLEGLGSGMRSPSQLT